MSNTTLRGERFCGLTIDKNGEGRSGDVGMYKAYELTLKAESMKGCNNEVPFEPVESLC